MPKNLWGEGALLADRESVVEKGHGEDQCTAVEKGEGDSAEVEQLLRWAGDYCKAQSLPELELSHMSKLVCKATALICTAVRPQSKKWGKQCSCSLLEEIPSLSTG